MDTENFVLSALKSLGWDATCLDNDVYLLNYLALNGDLLYIYLKIDAKKEILVFSGQFLLEITESIEDQILSYCNVVNDSRVTPILEVDFEERILVNRLGVSFENMKLSTQYIMNCLLKMCTSFEMNGPAISDIVERDINNKGVMIEILNKYLEEWTIKAKTMNWSVKR